MASCKKKVRTVLYCTVKVFRTRKNFERFYFRSRLFFFPEMKVVRSFLQVVYYDAIFKAISSNVQIKGNQTPEEALRPLILLVKYR